MAQLLGAAGSAIGSGASGAASGLGAGASAAGSAIGSGASALGSGISQGLGSLGGAVSNAAGAVGPAAPGSGFLGGLQTALTGAPTSGGLASGLGQGLGALYQARTGGPMGALQGLTSLEQLTGISGPFTKVSDLGQGAGHQKGLLSGMFSKTGTSQA